MRLSYIRYIQQISLILLAALILSGCSSGNSDLADSWTIMCYLDGDNNLEENALEDFNEMEKGLYDAIAAGYADISENLNIIVMIDRTRGEDSTITESGDTDWSDTRIYRIKPDNNPVFFNSERLDDGSDLTHHTIPCGEKNMGAPETLKNFIDYSLKNFTADNYALILWNHGSGAQKKSGTVQDQFSTKAICQDSDNNNDILFLDEVQQALSASFNSESKLEILGFDACLMATVEVAYEFRDLAQYMVGSMSYIQDDGWSYDNLISSVNGSSMSPASFATLMVQTYRAFIDSPPKVLNSGETISAIDLSEISTLGEKINALGIAIYDEDKKTEIESVRDDSISFYIDPFDSVFYPYCDLYDLCAQIQNEPFSSNLHSAANEVITALSSAILYSYGDNGNGQTAYFGPGYSTSQGLSIFFSRGNIQFDYPYDTPNAGLNSHYSYQWWYTVKNTALEFNDTDFQYGKIDFCTSNEDGTVDGWRELMEAWYDPQDDYTPSTF